MTPILRTVTALAALALVSPVTSATPLGGGGMPEIKLALGDKPLKYTVDLGFKLSCPHKLLAAVDDAAVVQVDVTDEFTKKPTYELTGLQLGSTIVTFDIIGQDTFEMTEGNCQGSATQQAMITVVPDLSSDEKDDGKDFKSIGKGYSSQLKDIAKTDKSFVKSIQKQFKDGAITYDEAVDALFAQAAGSMEQAYQLGMTAILDGASVGSATLSGVGQDGYHTDTYMQGAGGEWDRFFVGVTEDWWSLAQDIGPDLRKALDKLNKTSDLSDDELVEFNFVGTWSTFSQEPGPVGSDDDALSGVMRRPLKILCAAARALKCDPSSGRLSVGGWAEPDQDVDVAIFGPDEFTASDSTTADDDGAFQLTFQLSFVDAAPGALPSGLYRVEVSYAESDLGDLLYIQVP